MTKTNTDFKLSASDDTARMQIAAFFGLIVGAIAMGGSVVFVRIADVGPFASAFWRVAFALPLLLIWVFWENRQIKRAHPDKPLPTLLQSANSATVLSGLFFAGDLIFWHLAIVNTSVANATFMATTAPVFVILLSGLVLKEPANRGAFVGLGFCLVGGAALIGATLSFEPENLQGDIYGLITAAFFAGYFLCVRIARRTLGSARIMFISSCITTVALGLAAVVAEGDILPMTLTGLAILISLALTAHVLGQGLLAISLGFLPAAFSSLVIFMEAISAAVFGWVFLNEMLSLFQLFGGTLILLGITLARPRVKRRA
ncbi:MAG: DMT family transporter [Hyphomicrobiales bacterium]